MNAMADLDVANTSTMAGRRGEGEAKAHVLVVDDSPLVRKIVMADLRRAGIVASEAADGRQALALLRRQPFDVVVSDLAMPGLGGIDLIERLRREGAGTEIVLLTGTGQPGDETAERAIRLGAHAYIVKGPSSGRAVVLSVRSAVEKKRLREENARLAGCLRSQPLRDALTGLPDGRAFEAALTQEMERARRFEQPLALLLAGLDIPEARASLGAAASDAAFAQFAVVATRSLRDADALFRADEHTLAGLMPHTPAEGAQLAGRRLVNAVAASSLDGGAATLRLTCSVGVASASAPSTAAALRAAARSALRRASESGGNQVVLASPRAGASEPSRQGAVAARRR
jgi:diguanylate cyclase (GGDEF)-like protein